MIAENEDLPKLDTIERVGPGKHLIEVKAGTSRLLGFEDGQGSVTFICAETFWIGHSDKKTMQDRAIASGIEMRKRWRDAIPVAGVADTRLERKGNGK